MTVLPNFDSGTYEPPGIYVQETSTPSVASGSFSGPLGAIVGPGLGYRVYQDAAVVLTGTTPAALSQLGINTASIVVTSVNGLTTYVEGSGADYVFTSTASTDGNTEDTTTTIQRSSGSTITSGETVVVSYQYADASYYAPTLVTNLAAASALYGPAYSTVTGTVLSPLTLAASLAFQNGASQLILVAAQGNATSTTRIYLSSALAMLSAVDGVTLVAELPVGLTGTSGSPGDVENVATDFEAYLAGQNANEIYQIGFIGYESSVANGASGQLGADIIAEAVASERVVEVWPNAYSFYAGTTTLVLPGYYAAAALVGVAASIPADQPLTRMQVLGFSGFPPQVARLLTPANMNTLAAAGVCVLQVSNGIMQVRHGLTTNPATVYTKEISLVRIQDAMISALINGINNSSVIGGPLTENTIAAITGIVTTTLDNLINFNYLMSYTGVTVAVNSIVPTEVDVTFAYLPIYPLDYITISFSIDAAGA